MKKFNIIIGLIFLVVGVLSYLYLNFGPCWSTDYASCGLGRGMMTIYLSYPLIIVGIILSIIGMVIKPKA